MVDHANHWIAKYDGTGKYITEFGSYGTANGKFSNPANIAISSK